MDPNLTTSQVKDYILRGAQTARYDSMTAASTPAAAVQGYSFYQLDAYGALTLLAKERPSLPICGYPVSAGGPGNRYVMLEKNGPLVQPTDSIRVPGAGNAIGRISVAQGGRRISAYTGTDSLVAGTPKSVIVFNHLGQRLTHKANCDAQLFLERDTVEVRQLTGGSVWQEVTLRGSSSGFFSALTFPDGSQANAFLDDIDASPDGRFVSYRATRSAGGQRYNGVYIKRFSDQSTSAIQECLAPCAGALHPTWSHNGTKFLIGSSIVNPDATFTGFLQSHAVDLTQSGGFIPGMVETVPERMIDRHYRYSGDDAVVFTPELPPNSSSIWIAIRAAAALGTKSQEALVPYRQERQIGNIAPAHP